jgi:hypothetical protein
MASEIERVSRSSRISLLEDAIGCDPFDLDEVAEKIVAIEADELFRIKRIVLEIFNDTQVYYLKVMQTPAAFTHGAIDEASQELKALDNVLVKIAHRLSEQPVTTTAN